MIFTSDSAGINWFNATQTSYRRNGVEIGVGGNMNPGFDRVRNVHSMAYGTPRSGFPLVMGRDRDRSDPGLAKAYCPCDIGEVILLNNPTPEQRLACEAYLMSYWRGGSMVAVTGDSNSAGYDLLNTQAWPAVLDESWGGAVDFPNRAVTNMGIGASHSGVTITMLADDGTRIDPLLVGRTGTNILSAIAGLNDLIAGRTPAQVYADEKTHAAARRAAGWKVLGGTLIDCAYLGGSLRPAIATLNALRRADHSHYDLWVDVAADSRFAPNAANSTADYLPDGIHMNIPGAAYHGTGLVGPVIAPALPA